MEKYFGPDGFLANRIDNFEFRASQLEMAQAVFDCLKTEVPLLVEAGTGTGKTWAYLIPAILSGKRVIVSTGTKTLQDQILDHDIPFLKKFLFPRLHSVCLKGRRNYLCRRRFQDFSYQPTFWSKGEAKLMRRFESWAVRTGTGDRAEIDWLPDQFRTWDEVCSSTDKCIGQACPENSRCFLARVRGAASRAQLVIVNHHLFFADLALRGEGSGEILPAYDAVIFDEAHQLEDTISSYFGVRFSNLGLMDFMRDLLRESRKNAGNSRLRDLPGIAQQMETLSRLLHHGASAGVKGPGRYPFVFDELGAEFVKNCRQTVHALEQVSAVLTPNQESPPAFEALYRRSLDLARAVSTVLEQRDPGLVYWYELSQQAVVMNATPIDVASILRERLFPKTSAVAMTSATLAVAGSFDYFRNSLGMPREAREKVLASPFAFEEQAVIYIPSVFPAPHEPSFSEAVSRESLRVLEKSRGRALFLFTSYRQMNGTYQNLKERLSYPILVQGQKPKRALLGEFKEKIDSVLLATSSFWQGVDVPGEALSCLLIDKLPFEVPDDPVIKARMEHLEKGGKSAFFNYQVPRAIIQLKQGVGRLIRSSRDRGIIVIFDVRLFTKGYGRLFIKSLPPCRIVHSLDEIDDFV